MMAVSCFENGLNDIINGFNAGGSGVEHFRHGPTKIPEVTGAFFDPLAS